MSQPQTIQAAQADPSLTYYTAQHGVPVRVGDTTDEGVLLENVNTGGRQRVPTAYPLLLDEPTPDALIPSTPDPTAAAKPTKKPKPKVVPRLGRVLSVNSNIQGGIKLTFPGRLILLHGSNASKKTTTTRALELAGTAKASDVAGRGVTSKESMLIPLIDPAVDSAILSSMQVHLPATDSVVECLYNAKVKDATHASKAEHLTHGVKVVFPLRAVHEHLRGSPAKAQEWLLKTACGDLDRKAVLARLPKQAPVLFPKLAADTVPIVQALLDTVAEAPGRASSAKRKSEAATTEADRLATGLAPPASDEEMAALRATEQAAEVVLQQAIAANAASATLVAVAQEDLSANTARLNEIAVDVRERIDPALVQAIARLAHLQPDPNLAALQADREAGVRLMSKCLAGHKETCIFCGGALPQASQEAILGGLQTQMGAAAAADQERHAAFVALQQEIRGLQTQRAGAETEYARLAAKVNAGAPTPTRPVLPPDVVARIEQEGAAAGATPAQIEQAKAEAVRNRAMFAATGVSDAQAARDLHRQALNDAISRTEGWKRSREKRGESEAHAQDQRTYESLVKELQATVAWAVDEAADTFAARVQSLLPKDDVFWLDARTGRYGLVKTITGADGSPIRHRRDSALCGAEWARVTLALAGASTPTEADVAILVPEDRAWDAKTLRNALEGLVNYPGMVIITSTIKPFRGAPKGWHMIDMDEYIN